MKTPTTNELREALRLCMKDAASEKRASKMWLKGSSERAIRERYSWLFTVAADCIQKQIARRLADKKRRAKG